MTRQDTTSGFYRFHFLVFLVSLWTCTDQGKHSKGDLAEDLRAMPISKS